MIMIMKPMTSHTCKSHVYPMAFGGHCALSSAFFSGSPSIKMYANKIIILAKKKKSTWRSTTRRFGWKTKAPTAYFGLANFHNSLEMALRKGRHMWPGKATAISPTWHAFYFNSTFSLLLLAFLSGSPFSSVTLFTSPSHHSTTAPHHTPCRKCIWWITTPWSCWSRIRDPRL